MLIFHLKSNFKFNCIIRKIIIHNISIYKNISQMETIKKFVSIQINTF